jgi:mannosyltransferase OCH1-like enzyme
MITISNNNLYILLLIHIILLIVIILKIISNHKKKIQKKIFPINDKIINSIDIQKYIPNIPKNIKTSANIIISLTTIPTRIVRPEFNITIKKLKSQVLKPNFIVVNVCKSYSRQFVYDEKEFKKKIDEYKTDKDILLNICDDYGPATKALGLVEIKHLFNSDDIVICVDDDISYSELLTYYHVLTLQIYNCDSTAIDETTMIDNKNIFTNIFDDNYKGRYYGWLSFSFKFKYIESLVEYYNKFKTTDEKIIGHDDLLFTSFFHLNNVYICGINLYLSNRSSSLVELDALKNRQNERIIRDTLENKFLTSYIKPKSIKIDDEIKERYLLFNIDNYKTNKYDNIHYDVKYYNNNIIIITLTRFNLNDNTNEYIYIEIGDYIYQLIINPKDLQNKITMFVKLDETILKVNNTNKNNILQTFKTNQIDILKFYSITTILNVYPNFVYTFYSDARSIEYFKKKDKRLIAYFNKLKPGAYKSDLFRAVYLYYEGGLYLDCKFVAIQSMNKLISTYDEFYCLDANITNVYNAIMYAKNEKSAYLKTYINLMLRNIRNQDYNVTPLHITGPGLLGKVIHNKDIKIYYTQTDFMFGYICDIKTDTKYFSTNYSTEQYYKGKDKYLNTTHYGILWKKRDIFTNEKVEDVQLE